MQEKTIIQETDSGSAEPYLKNTEKPLILFVFQYKQKTLCFSNHSSIIENQGKCTFNT